MKKVVSIVLMFTMLISLFTIGVNADNAVTGENGNVTKIENTFDVFTAHQGANNFVLMEADADSDGKYVQVNKTIPGTETQLLYGDPANSKFKVPAVDDKYIYKADFKVVGPENGNPAWAGVKFSAMLRNDYWQEVDLGIQYAYGTWKIGGTEVANPFGDTAVQLNNWHTLNAVAEVKDTTNGATMEVTYYLDGVECETKGTATIAASRTIASVGICNLNTVNFAEDKGGYTVAFDNFVVAVYEGNTDLIPTLPAPPTPDAVTKTVIGFDDYDNADAWYTWKDRFEKITTEDRIYIRANATADTTLYRNDLFTNKKMGDLAVGQKYIYSVDFMIEDVNGNASWPVASSGVTLTPMVMGNWTARNLGVSIPTGAGKGVMVYNDTSVPETYAQMDYTPDGTETGTQFYTTASTFTEKLHEDTWYTLTCVFEITGEDTNNFTGTTVSYINGERLAKSDGTGWADSTFTWSKTNTSFLSQPALYARSGNLSAGHVLAVDNLVLAVYEGNENLIPANAAKLNMQEGIKIICDKAANTSTATVKPLALKENLEYWLIVAAYNTNGKMTDVKLVPYTAELGKFAEKTAVLENISTEATYVRAFIWSKGNITPLANFVGEIAPSLLED